MDIVYSYSIGFLSSGLIALLVAVAVSIKKGFSLPLCAD